ncbi:MAG TPA: flagellar hook-basal body protein [Ramlibacter sp.]|uniref:flagellar hook-basal body protein n=1 Tax=Ramlibacter sp. TaxID=1917967 RepID=UPI002C7F8D77|nr:flagellar hook-basal body protein [Ramlibacter sp.]HVZ46131.1 flagellar hook-basal body protein [Ramlibacter sp.]
MSEVFAVALQGMQADMTRVRQVGMNLANALTTGYKGSVVVQTPVGTSFAGHLTGAAATAPTLEDAAADNAVSIRHDMRTGTLKSTGQALDVAITGRGFLEVITPDGPAYTRQGNLRLDAQGRLVTAQGYPVQGTAGDIVLTTSSPVIDGAGLLLGPSGEEDAPLAELKLVEFEPGTEPRALGEGLFAAGAAMKTLAREDRQVRQGALENSNVSSIDEMTQLIHSMRHFEALHKMAQAYDEMLGTAIRKLGES